jgi:hypothetical protein
MMKKITLLFILILNSIFSFAQDSCAGALPVTAGTHVISTVNGAPITTSCAGTGTVTASEWYAYTPSQNYTVTVTTDLAVNICRDTRFHVYTGACGSLLCFTSDDDSGIINCNSGNTNSYLSTKTFDVVAGTTYYIAFDNRWESNGFSFQITESPIIVVPNGPISFTNQTINTITSGGGNYNICVVDMNGDHLDDIVTVSSTNIRVHNQNFGGGFTVSDFTTTAAGFLPSWSLAAGDYNRDGYNDLLYGSGSGLTFMKSNSTGTAFTQDTPGQYIFCQRTNFADINNDGHLDAFSCHDVDPNVYYLNDGSGNFTYYQSGVTPGSVNLGIIPNGGNYASIWSDIDNDGDVDMFVSKCSGPPCELHRNNGDGTYTDISAISQINVTPIQSWSSGVADFDNDGDMDILIGANGSSGHKYFRNDLNTTNGVDDPFANITAGSGWDTNTSTSPEHIAYDFDNNGFVDVMGGGNKIMFNQGDGTFVPFTYGFGVCSVGDLNNDGFLDFQNGSTLKINTGNTNKWIKLSLAGIQSNSNGIGARVEIYGAFGKQIRDVRSGEGFRYMSSLNVHFGIGQATAITQVIIRWPSGIIDTINNPSINSTLFVTEGSTLSNESFTNSEFSIFPIPTKNILNIKTNASISLKSAQVFDLNGRRIIESTIENESINVQSLTTGTYIILLTDANGKNYSQKFTKE